MESFIGSYNNNIIISQKLTISVLGALNLIITEYCPKWKMLDHWKLAKDLCVCVCERERERESIMTHQREVGE